MFPMNQGTNPFFPNMQSPTEAMNAFQNMFSANAQSFQATKAMTAGNEQLTAALRAGMEKQFAFYQRLTSVAVQGAEKVIDLNMAAAKTSMEESVVGARQLLGSKDAQEAVGFVAALPQPTVTKMVAYFRHLTTITNEAQSEVTRATEEQFAEMGRQVLGVMEQAFRNAPAGSENALAAVRSAITTANAGLEQFNQNAKKAVDTVEASVNQAVDQAVQVAEQASTAAARARKQ